MILIYIVILKSFHCNGQIFILRRSLFLSLELRVWLLSIWEKHSLKNCIYFLLFFNYQSMNLINFIDKLSKCLYLKKNNIYVSKNKKNRKWDSFLVWKSIQYCYSTMKQKNVVYSQLKEIIMCLFDRIYIRHIGYWEYWFWFSAHMIINHFLIAYKHLKTHSPLICDKFSART